MKNRQLLFLLLPFILISCASQSAKNADRQVDSRLGVEAEDDNQDAQSALQEQQQRQQQEQRRQIERQITDPLTAS